MNLKPAPSWPPYFVPFPKLLKGIYLSRYKRFLMDVTPLDGEAPITLHCANSGSMESLLQPNTPVYFWDSQNPLRKLRFSAELMELADGFACINTSRANQLMEALFCHLLLAQKASFGPLDKNPFLDAESLALLHKDFETLQEFKPEAPFGQGTRFDFCLNPNGPSPSVTWVEVKSVSLQTPDGRYAFPDAITQRGQKHLKMLMESCAQGKSSHLIFVVMRGSKVPAKQLAQTFHISAKHDPAYFKAFQLAQKQGVKIRVLAASVDCLGLGVRGYYEFTN